MTYVITQNCCKDASCAPVCPVECIRPTGGTGSFTDTEVLYIEPDVCIDCGACQEECPVGRSTRKMNSCPDSSGSGWVKFVDVADMLAVVRD